MGGEYAGGIDAPAPAYRRGQRQEPEPRPRRAPRGRVPGARGRDRGGGDRARVSAPAGRHPDGPAPARRGRRGRGRVAEGGAPNIAHPGRGDDRAATRPARRLARRRGVRGIDLEADRYRPIPTAGQGVLRRALKRVPASPADAGWHGWRTTTLLLRARKRGRRPGHAERYRPDRPGWRQT